VPSAYEKDSVVGTTALYKLSSGAKVSSPAQTRSIRVELGVGSWELELGVGSWSWELELGVGV